MSLTYAGYLKTEKLLALQAPLSEGPAHDEMLFIIIHQAYELWFKQVLHETSHLISLLSAGHRDKIPHTIKRIRTIIQVLVHQWDILETLTPDQFMTFRGSLGTASGFQSVQFRELEFTFGYKRPDLLSEFDKTSSEYQRLADRINKPSVWDGFLSLLNHSGYDIPQQSQPSTPAKETISPDPGIQKILQRIYQSDTVLRDICEGLIDIDSGIQKWRYHHVKMVERTIGGKPGTGGSSGAAYLRGTLFKPLFPELWTIRSHMGEKSSET